MGVPQLFHQRGTPPQRAEYEARIATERAEDAKWQQQVAAAAAKGQDISNFRPVAMSPQPEPRTPPVPKYPGGGPQSIGHAYRTYGALGAARWANEQGLDIPSGLQVEAFKEAGATGISESQIEKMFGLPAGAAAQFAKSNAIPALPGVYSPPTGGIGNLPGIPPIGTQGTATTTTQRPSITYVDPVTGLPTHEPPAVGAGNPMTDALNIINSGGQPTPEQQIAAFEHARKSGTSAATFEQLFGVPAGTAARVAAELGIDNLSTAPAGGQTTTITAGGGQIIPPAVTPATGIGTLTQTGTPAAVTPAAVTPAAVTPAAVTPAAVTPAAGIGTLTQTAGVGPTAGVAQTIAANIANTVTNQQGGLGSLSPTQVAGGVGTTEGAVALGADGQPVVTDGSIDTYGIPGATTGAGTTTTIGGTTAAGTTAAGTTAAGGLGSLASLVNKFKTTGNLSQSELQNLIGMARSQGVSANELANMAGVPVETVTTSLQAQGYAADYLAGGQKTLVPGSTSVTTPSDATTTITRESPEIEARKLGVIDLAKQLASQEPTGGLPPEQVAALSPLERSAYQATVDSFGGFLPAVQQGYQTVGTGLRALTDLYGNRLPTADASIRGAVQGYDPFVAQGIGALGQGRQLVTDVVQGAQPYLAESGQYGRDAAGFGIGSYADAMKKARGAKGRAYRAGDIGLASAASGMRQLAGTGDQYDPYSTMSYMNPYEQQVIDAAMGDIRREGNKQLMAQRAQAVGAGAFGGSRAALAESELNRNIMEQQAKTSANLRAQGYTQAQANSMASFEASQRRRQQGAQMMGSLGTQGAQTSLQAAQQAQTGAIQGGQLGGQTAGGIRDTGTLLGNLGTGYGQLGMQGAEIYGRQAGLLGQLGESRANLGLRGVQQYGDVTKQGVAMADLARQYGLNQAELGQVGQTMNIRDLATLEAAGGRLRQQEQTQLDVARQNKLQDIYEPYQRIGFMSDVLRGAPSTQMQLTKNYTQQPSRAAQAIGGIGSLVSTAAGAKQANII